MIAILCPTRGRPEQFDRMCRSVYATTSNAHPYPVYILSTGARDYKNRFVPDIELPENLPTAHKWNLLAQEAMKLNTRGDENKLFMLGADDMVFETPGWDKALIDHYNALENKIHVYALQDSRDKDGTPHPIVTREYIEAAGYFVPPIFLHWFIDSWTVDIAQCNGAFTHFRDYKLAHIKPSDEGKPDETHSRIRQWGWHERDKWVAKKCGHFLEYEKRRLADTMAQSPTNSLLKAMGLR